MCRERERERADKRNFWCRPKRKSAAAKIFSILNRRIIVFPCPYQFSVQLLFLSLDSWNDKETKRLLMCCLPLLSMFAVMAFISLIHHHHQHPSHRCQWGKLFNSNQRRKWNQSIYRDSKQLDWEKNKTKG